MDSAGREGVETRDAGRAPEAMLMSSRGFTSWLREADVSLAFTTYQAGRLFMIGRRLDGALWAHERMIEQCQGLWTDGETLWTSGLHSLWRMGNVLDAGAYSEKGADRLFAPRESRVTGAVDCHDIGVGVWGDEPGRRPIFVNTLFSCLATISDSGSFRTLWRPPFVSATLPEDRCHLNGMAMAGDRPSHVTAVSRSDVVDGWRERRADGGVVIDVASGEIVAQGLSMPHSPRLHDGKLWLLNSGAGVFGHVDLASGAFTDVCFCPGYARGLAFAGQFAVIGLSRPRRNATFTGLALDDALAARDSEARCGLIIVDLRSGAVVEWLRIEHTIDELYDVAVLPGVRQAEVISFRGDPIRRTFRLDQSEGA